MSDVIILYGADVPAFTRGKVQLSQNEVEVSSVREMMHWIALKKKTKKNTILKGPIQISTVTLKQRLLTTMIVTV